MNDSAHTAPHIVNRSGKSFMGRLPAII